MMGMFVANKVIKLMIQNGINVKGANVLILGITFKENCPDTRNSKVIDIIKELDQFGAIIDVYDPYADAKSVKKEYNVDLIGKIKKKYDSVILAVSHKEFLEIDFQMIINTSGVLFDTKAFIDREIVSCRL